MKISNGASPSIAAEPGSVPLTVAVAPTAHDLDTTATDFGIDGGGLRGLWASPAAGLRPLLDVAKLIIIIIK